MNRYAKALRIVNPKKPILEDRSLLAVKIVKDPAYTYPDIPKDKKKTDMMVAHYEPQDNPLMEKKNLDAVEPKEHKGVFDKIKKARLKKG